MTTDHPGTRTPAAPRGVTVRAMTPQDWPAVAAVYAEGLEDRSATFETEVPAWEAWDAGHSREHRWVATADGALLGWVACSPVSSRCVYAGVLEHSVYVARAARGRGVGSALLARLVASTEAAGVWTLQAGVFPENTASLALHVRHGFRVVGTRTRVGRLDGAWRDVTLIERRSDTVGIA